MSEDSPGGSTGGWERAKSICGCLFVCVCVCACVYCKRCVYVLHYSKLVLLH